MMLVFTLITLPLIILINNKDIQNRFGNQFFNYILDNGVKNFYYTSQYGAHFGTGIEIIKNYPLTGIGFKNFHTECEKKNMKIWIFCTQNQDALLIRIKYIWILHQALGYWDI